MIVRFLSIFLHYYTFPDRYLVILSSLSWSFQHFLLRPHSQEMTLLFISLFQKRTSTSFPHKMYLFIYWHLPDFCLLIYNCLYSYFRLTAPLVSKFSSSPAYSMIPFWKFPTAHSTLYNFLFPESFPFAYTNLGCIIISILHTWKVRLWPYPDFITVSFSTVLVSFCCVISAHTI